MQLLILWFFLFSTVLSCSSTDFDSVYDDYPDCAASCLGCRDETYYSNFANNCNYSSGDCCTSQYHNSIAQTWDCVSTNCGDQVSKDAFKTFVTFCKDNKTPLEEKDVPSGYELSDGDDKKDGDSSEKKKPLLETWQIITISIGGATFLVGVISLVFKFRHFLRDMFRRMLGGSRPANDKTNYLSSLELAAMPMGNASGPTFNISTLNVNVYPGAGGRGSPYPQGSLGGRITQLLE